MPGALSKQVLPPSVNPRKFAYQDTLIEGTIASDKLDRFRSAVVIVNGTIDAKLHFYIDGSGKAVVEGEVTAEVALVCQRCLENVSKQVCAKLCLALVKDEEQSKALAKSYDPWLVDSEDGSADLYATLEDELLLALPMVAFHPEPCIDAVLLSAKDPAQKDEETAERTNPFKVLEQLKTAPKK